MRRAAKPEARFRGGLRLAKAFAAWVDADPDWERVAPAAPRTVVFRLRPRGVPAGAARLNPLNERLLDAVNAAGETRLSHTVLDGRYLLCLEIGSRTGECHVQRAWEILRAEALRLGGTPPVIARS